MAVVAVAVAVAAFAVIVAGYNVVCLNMATSNVVCLNAQLISYYHVTLAFCSFSNNQRAATLVTMMASCSLIVFGIGRFVQKSENLVFHPVGCGCLFSLFFQC